MRPIKYLLISSFILYSCSPEREISKPVLMNVLWDQADTSHNNYRIPSIIVTQKNSLLAFAEGREGGDAGDIDILLKRSSDNGKTWEKQIVVWDDGDNTCGNPCPVVDKTTGRILLFMTWNPGSDHENEIIMKTSGGTRIPYICYSDNDGLSWSEPRSLLETCKVPEWGWYATGPGVGIQITSLKYMNRLVIPCNNSYNSNNKNIRNGFGYGCHVLISDDGGENWRMSEIISPEVNESQLVELNDGVLLMNMRSYNNKGCRAISFSYDGGETWSEIIHEPQLVEPVCQASLINYNQYHGKKMYLFSNPSVPFDRTHMTIKASFTDCQNWSNSKLVYSGPSAYSCLTKLPDGNIGLFFEAGEKSPYEKMVFISFSPEELFKPGTLLNSLKN